MDLIRVNYGTADEPHYKPRILVKCGRTTIQVRHGSHYENITLSRVYLTDLAKVLLPGAELIPGQHHYAIYLGKQVEATETCVEGDHDDTTTV